MRNVQQFFKISWKLININMFVDDGVRTAVWKMYLIGKFKRHLSFANEICVVYGVLLFWLKLLLNMVIGLLWKGFPQGARQFMVNFPVVYF